MASIMIPVVNIDKTTCSNLSKASLTSVKQLRDSFSLLIPKKKSLRVVNVFGNGAVRSNTVYAPVPSTNGGSPGGSADKTSSIPGWSVLTEEISVGPFPRSPRDLELLVQSTGINAFVLLETEEGVKQIGLDWEDFRTRVNQQGAVAVRLSMKANDRKDQISSLPEAVRAVAALVTMGYKVHVSCTNGTHRSPLVALGFMTMMKGMTLTEAWQIVNKASPLANPCIDILKEVADRKLRDAFQRGVATDVSLSDAVAKATTTKATRVAFEQLHEYKTRTEAAAQSASSASDKLEFFSRQIISLKEKEEVARKAAALAVKEKEALSRQLQLLKSAGSTPAVAVTQAALAEVSSVSADASAQALLQGRALKDEESATKKELAKAQSALQTVVEKYKTIELSVSDAVEGKKQAEVKLKEAKSELQNLERRNMGKNAREEKKALLKKAVAEAETSMAGGQDKVEFFHRQLEALKAKETQAKEAVSAAQSKLDSLSAQIASLKTPSVSAVSAPVSVASPLSEAALQTAIQNEAKAKEALAATSQKLDFFTRRLEEQKQKQEAENKKAEQKISVFSEQVAEFKLKLAAADVLAVENEKKIGALSQQIDEYQKREKVAAEATKTQSDRLDFFARHMESLRGKEEAAKKAAKAASENAKSLERKVNDLASREAMAVGQINELNNKVATLVQLNAEQGLELIETKEREAQLLQVLEDGTGVLSKALESDKAIKQLRQEVKEAMNKYEKERVRADLLAADLERELVASGKKQKHYNDIEKDLEKQLLSQLATTKQTLVASGTSLGVALEEDKSGDQIALRDIILGALSMAAVPVTLMTIFADAQPSRIAEFVDSQEPLGKNELVQILAPAEVIPPKPVVQPSSADAFCKQTLTGSRSARVERFCNSLAEISLE